MPITTNALPAFGTGLTLVTVLTASTAIGDWAPPAPSPSSGTITFTIETVAAAPDMNAPYFGFFRAANIVGAQRANGDAVVEPAETPGADNLYDPTQHHVTFRWGFGDPSYTPRVIPNIPAVWRNMNIGSGRQVSHVWSAAGTYEIECIAEDQAGNFGFATLERVVTSRDTLYPTTQTICVSQASNFADAPAGAQQVTSVGAAMTAGNIIRQNANIALRAVRILLRAGEVFDNIFMQFGDWGTADVSLHIGTFGGADRAVVNSTMLSSSGIRIQIMSALGRRHVWENIEFRGPYRAWEEVGQALIVNTALNNRTITLFSRCKMDGLSEWSSQQENAFVNLNPGIIYHDTEITNWNNYGLLLFPRRWAHLGCDIHQHPDALNGNEQGEGSQQFTQLGGRHGPFRGGAAQGYSSCSSYFSRNGWSRS